MDATATAPTITIDGVTSKPGEPITMVVLDCDNHMIIDGHVEEGNPVLCDDGPHENAGGIYCFATNVFQTWKF